MINIPFLVFPTGTGEKNTIKRTKFKQKNFGEPLSPETFKPFFTQALARLFYN